MWRLLVAGLLLLDAPISPARADIPVAGPPSDITVSVIRGQMAVRSRCATCHAVGLDDASPNPRSPPLRTIGARYPVENLSEALAEGIMVSHRQEMPVFALGPDEIADIVAYLKELRRESEAREISR